MDVLTVAIVCLLPSVGFAAFMSFAAWWRGRKERRVLAEAEQIIEKVRQRPDR